MQNVQNRLFRKVALDRLSSPEQLDQLMKITSPRAWLALIAIAVLLVAGALWAIFGSIPEETEGNGVLVNNPANDGLEAVIYVPLDEGAQLRPGMEVEVEVSTVKTETYGYVKAVVREVGDVPVTRQQVLDTVGNDEIANSTLPSGPVLEVRLELKPSDNTESGFEWTSQDGPPRKLTVGTPIAAIITVSEDRPISRVFPVFE
ncbi:MAG: hypothetical protein DPW16_08880 [Chloroflexi bacterium]|nr:hypothetical protein [Chloroflexota bacterium]